MIYIITEEEIRNGNTTTEILPTAYNTFDEATISLLDIVSSNIGGTLYINLFNKDEEEFTIYYSEPNTDVESGVIYTIIKVEVK